MAALTTAAVSNLSSGSVTVTFNAAAIDCTATQLRQLEKLFALLAANNSANEGSGNTSVTITGLTGVSL
jgi:hypothetical protein